MEIHLARDGSALGIFSEQEVREGLALGRFRSSDLAWRAGMAAWTPLAEWAEFAAAAAPGQPDPSSSPPSEVPWEQSPGLGSLFRTLGIVLASPGKLASGRFAFGQSLGLAFAAIGVGFLPIVGLAVLSAASQEAKGEALLALLKDLDGPFFDGVRMSIRESTEGDGVAFGIPVAACTALFLPFFGLLLALFEWVGLRVTGAKLPFARTVSAGMAIHTLVTVALLPLSLLVALIGLALPLFAMAGEFVLIPVSLVFLALALGRAYSLNPWRLVLAWVVLAVAFCGCVSCCGGLAGLLGAAARG